MNLLKDSEPLFEFPFVMNLNTYLFLQITGESYHCDLVFVQVHFPVLHLLNYLKNFHQLFYFFNFSDRLFLFDFKVISFS